MNLTNIQTTSVEDNFILPNFQNLHCLEYFGHLRTIHKFRFSRSFLNKFIDYISVQNGKIHRDNLWRQPDEIIDLATRTGTTGQPTSSLQNLMAFHNLQTLMIYDETIFDNRIQIPLDEDSTITLHVWLHWSNKLGLGLNISEMVVDEESWAHGLLGEVVDELEIVDVTVKQGSEVEDASELDEVEDVEESDEE